MSTLVIDIGNTSTSAGCYRDGVIFEPARCPSRFGADREVDALLANRAVDQVVVASVVPEINDRWRASILGAGLPEPLFVHHRLELGVTIDYPKPERIGPDRLANAAAAARLLGTPSVVCDFGTALTFDVIDGERGYIGGVICPGLPLMFDYLAERTALLPHVQPVKTTEVVGRNTEQAMQIGARLGYRGMVREVLNSLKGELGVDPVPLCCTGGYAGWIFEGWDIPADVDPDLTLKGLGIIGELNG